MKQLRSWKVRITLQHLEHGYVERYYVVDENNVEEEWDAGKVFYSRKYAEQLASGMKAHADQSGAFQFIKYELIEVI